MKVLRQIANLLKQRRIWAGIVGVISFFVSILNVDYSIETSTLTELLTNFGTAFSALIIAGLALWSYFNPKK